MGTLLDRLAAEEILPAKTVLDLREYISKKHPSLSLASKAAVFADAVNRILDDKIPLLPDDRLKKFKVVLFRDAAEKKGFCINGSDIFKSAVRLRMKDDPFIDALGGWLEKTLEMPVDRDKVSGFITSAHAMMDESPDIELDRLISLAEENIGGIGSDSGKKTGAEHRDIESNVIPFVTPDTEKGIESGIQENGNVQETGNMQKTGNMQETGSKIFSVGPLPAKSLAFKYFPVKRNALKAIAAVGLIGLSVLLSYYSVLYINTTENKGLSLNGNVAVIEQEELPAGAVVPADPQNNGSGIIKMTATAYDLSFESCGKERSHPAYGVTSSGTRATVGRTIAVDPEVIPIGSRVKIKFPEKYSYLDGIYIAEDTGSLIKGNRVDVFFGEDKIGSKTVNKLAMDFGVQDVEVEVLE